MVWYKKKIVVVPMVVVALIFCVAVPMAVTSNRRKGSVSASLNGPQDEVPPIDNFPNDKPEEEEEDGLSPDRDIAFDDEGSETTPSPTTRYADLLPRIDEMESSTDPPPLAPSDAPSMVPSDTPSVVPSNVPSAATFTASSPAMLPHAYIGASDYPSVVPTDYGTTSPTKGQRFLKYGGTSAPTPVPSLEKAYSESDYPSIVPQFWETPAPTKPEQRMDQSPITEQKRRHRRRQI